MQKYLSQELSRVLDERLMNEFAFSIDQLMELAGLSVAEVVTKEVPPGKVLVVCGPGNNGGDGLVAARHLFHFGYQPTVCYPRETTNSLYLRLITQCRTLQIPILPSLPEFTDFSVIVDAIFGFSFKGEIRAPYDGIIEKIKESKKAVVSIDIPSGWDVENGNTSGKGIDPSILVSLSVPKPCVRHFNGVHYLGGRFVPPALALEFSVEIPQYMGFSQCVKL